MAFPGPRSLTLCRGRRGSTHEAQEGGRQGGSPAALLHTRRSRRAPGRAAPRPWRQPRARAQRRRRGLRPRAGGDDPARLRAGPRPEGAGAPEPARRGRGPPGRGLPRAPPRGLAALRPRRGEPALRRGGGPRPARDRGRVPGRNGGVPPAPRVPREPGAPRPVARASAVRAPRPVGAAELHARRYRQVRLCPLRVGARGRVRRHAPGDALVALTSTSTAPAWTAGVPAASRPHAVTPPAPDAVAPGEEAAGAGGARRPALGATWPRRSTRTRPAAGRPDPARAPPPPPPPRAGRGSAGGGPPRRGRGGGRPRGRPPGPARPPPPRWPSDGGRPARAEGAVLARAGSNSRDGGGGPIGGGNERFKRRADGR